MSITDPRDEGDFVFMGISTEKKGFLASDPRSRLKLEEKNFHYTHVQWGQSQVWFDSSEFREQGLGLFVGDAWVDNDIVTWNPVNRSGDSVLVTGLQRVDDSQNLSSVSTSRSWVGQDQSDGLLWVDNEDRSDGELDTLVVDISCILVVDHVVLQSDLSFRVGNDWESKLGAGHLINVLDPGLVRVGTVSRQTNELHTPLGELWLQFGKSTKLGGADWGEVVWVREQNSPRVANVLVERNWAVRGVGREVWSNRSESECSVVWLWN
ncbi:hypothetical protein OGATHE_005047 [Ogataea polymorpha]|uniref:Uncharacterized protein n=1 Tax=Ogataea polymorpha TaxID=460523 RepID=A0A9P8NWC2_9ASCO|nr:hypothetical protein OGATHE_005047 [Ogataea polymorpha]